SEGWLERGQAVAIDGQLGARRGLVAVLAARAARAAGGPLAALEQVQHDVIHAHHLISVNYLRVILLQWREHAVATTRRQRHLAHRQVHRSRQKGDATRPGGGPTPPPIAPGDAAPVAGPGAGRRRPRDTRARAP